MTSHQIAVAKASFSAGLLRPDPSSVPRDEITSFHDALDRMLVHCSPANVQTCKSWLLDKVVPSAKRVGVLGKYLAALSVSFHPADEQPQAGVSRSKSQRISSKRKRLHLLYLLNDLLHHTKYHGENPSAFSTLSAALQPYLVDLFDLAAGYDRQRNPKHYGRINELLDIWGGDRYYSAEYVNKLRQAVEHAASLDTINAKAAAKDSTVEPDKKSAQKDPPFVMPAAHGDPSLAWHELPAGNLMPLIVPNSSAQIRSHSVKPLQFLAGPADETLVKAVKGLLKDVDRIYNTSGGVHDEEELVDIDELGQIVVRDDTTGEITEGDGYYGWSRPFCQKMKERRDGKVRSRSPSCSRSRSPSSSPRMRRRYSGSDEQDRNFPEAIRSSTGRMYRRARSTSRPRSLSRSLSRSPVGNRASRRPPSYSPRPTTHQERSPPNMQHQQQQQQHQQPPYAAAPPPPPPSMQYPFQGPPQFTPPSQQAGSPGSFAAPPRPPNYHGPWPPPPPPMLPHHPSPGPPFPQNMEMNMNMGMGMDMPIQGFGSQFPHSGGGQHFMPPDAPPPPPPPPPGPQSHTVHPGHGNHQPYHRGRGRGRGGWSRGGW